LLGRTKALAGEMKNVLFKGEYDKAVSTTYWNNCIIFIINLLNIAYILY
jgi:hypothetical protein